MGLSDDSPPPGATHILSGGAAHDVAHDAGIVQDHELPPESPRCGILYQMNWMIYHPIPVHHLP